MLQRIHGGPRAEPGEGIGDGASVGGGPSTGDPDDVGASPGEADGAPRQELVGAGVGDVGQDRGYPWQWSDAGMSTVEYAVGTVVAAAFAAVLYKIVTGDSVIAGLTNLINTALSTTF